MDEMLIENWNKQVGTNDTVYHLGDFAFLPLADTKAVLRRLNGNKHFIKGNHDKTIINYLVDFSGHNLFLSIQDYKEINYGGEMFCLFHYGQRVWNKSHHGSIHLYGHSHGTLPPFGKSVDVGVDCKEITAEYRPVSADEVLAYMSKVEFVPIDHHGKKDM
jgi:calcineurin-like phosphoesterase family protein